MGINTIVLEGRITQPETRTNANGTTWMTFRLATNMYRGKDKEDETMWTQVKVWGKQAESLSRILTKGMQVVVQGNLDYNEWEAKDGSGKRSAHCINALSILLPPKPKDEDYAPVAVYSDDDIPF